MKWGEPIIEKPFAAKSLPQRVYSFPDPLKSVRSDNIDERREALAEMLENGHPDALDIAGQMFNNGRISASRFYTQDDATFAEAIAHKRIVPMVYRLNAEFPTVKSKLDLAA